MRHLAAVVCTSLALGCAVSPVGSQVSVNRGASADPQELNDLCGRAGLKPDYASGACVSSRGVRIDPYASDGPYQSPLPPTPGPNRATACGVRGMDPVTGRCL